MIADLKPYPAYTESGLPWLGEMPTHWERTRVKNLARHGYKTFVDGDWIETPFIRGAGVRLIQTGNIGLGTYREKGFRYIDEETFRALGCTEIEPGDVLICRLGDPVGRACLAPNLGLRMITSVDVCILKTRPEIASGFVVDVMSASPYLQWIGSLVRGSTRDRVSRSMLGGFWIPLPPPDEQGAIVRFLDWANGRLERAIRAKRKAIALLNERKQAVMHRAVMGGIDPSAPLKPSGASWLGEIPVHWETRRNGQLFAQRNQTGFGELPILEVSLRTGVRVRRFEGSARKQVMSDRGKYKRAARGDLTYNMMRLWQGAVGIAPEDGLVSPAYVVARPLEGVDVRYFNGLFHTSAYMGEVNACSRGIVKDRNRLYWEDFQRISSPCPPFDEQRRIVSRIEEETAEVDVAMSRLEREIALLREYRTRLVADLVTGKLDVRQAAARLPDEAPPEAVADEDEAWDDEPELADELVAV